MRYYKVTNISGQKVTLLIKNSDGQDIEDHMEIDEVCYGLNEKAAKLLVYYAVMGLIRIEMTDSKHPPDKVNWLAEGF